MSNLERDRPERDGEERVDMTGGPLLDAREWLNRGVPPRVKSAEIAGEAVSSMMTELARTERRAEELERKLREERQRADSAEWEAKRQTKRANDLSHDVKQTRARLGRLVSESLQAARTEPRPSARTNVRKALDRLIEVADVDRRWLAARGL